jgi:ABC-2 type transport system ATP-binding protein
MELQHPAIVCRNVTKRFSKRIAVSDFSLEVSSGICAVLGPNGAGKSTLLRLLSGLMNPDVGEVRVCGLPPEDSRRRMGVMPENLGLFDLLTVREHLELTGSVYGLSKEETRKRVRGLTHILGLDSAQHLFLNQCSHGMRKKTSLAAALLHAPRVLFLDEPFEGIDPASALAIQALLRTTAEGGATAFFTSHTLAAVERIATRIIVINNGTTVWDSANHSRAGALEELYLSLIEQLPLEDLSWLRSSQS